MAGGNSNYPPNNASASGLLARLKRDHPDTGSLCGSVGATGGESHTTPNLTVHSGGVVNG